jgi:hypothetical protein
MLLLTYAARACHPAKWQVLLSRVVLAHYMLQVSSLFYFSQAPYCFVHSLFHAISLPMLELQCVLALALCHGFQTPSQKHAVHSLQNWSYKAFNSEYVLCNWPTPHCTWNPMPHNTQPYTNFPHDATHLCNVTNLKPPGYSGLSCTFFSLRIYRLHCRRI